MQHRLSNLIYSFVHFDTILISSYTYRIILIMKVVVIKNHNSKPERKTVWEMFLFVQPYDALTAYYS